MDGIEVVEKLVGLITYIYVKTSHLFGINMHLQLFEDIVINYPHYDLVRDWGIDSPTVGDVERMKEVILTEFEKNPKLEKRCKNCGMVYMTFYPSDAYRGGTGSTVKIFMYVDGELYYPNKNDREKYNRIQKIKQIV